MVPQYQDFRSAILRFSEALREFGWQTAFTESDGERNSCHLKFAKSSLVGELTAWAHTLSFCQALASLSVGEYVLEKDACEIPDKDPDKALDPLLQLCLAEENG